MNTLMRFLMAFVGGILLYQWRIIPNYVAYGVFGLAFLAFLFGVFSKKTSRLFRGSSLLLVTLVAGFLHTNFQDISQQPTHISRVSLDSLTAYEAVVSNMPEQKRSTFKVEILLKKGLISGVWRPLSGKVVLYIDQRAPLPTYGQVLAVGSAPQPVAPPTNPDQFDYQRFLSFQQIYHQHYLRTNDFVRTDRNEGIWYKKWAYNASQWANVQLKRLVPYDREYAVTKAMVLGLRDEMDFDLAQAYSVAGAVHVLSVSGFHISIFIYILSYLLRFLEKRKYGRWLYLGLTLGIMWFYAVLTGLSAPVIRSALMISIFLLATPLHRKQNIEGALFGSAIILLLLDPLLIFSVSFQLSYAALAGIIFLQPTVYQLFAFDNKLFDKLWEITAVALVAQVATFPLAVYYFHQFPTYFWLANPAVFGLAFLQLPAALATVIFSWVPYLAEFLGWVTTIITWLLNETIVQTERIPYAKIANLNFSGIEVLLCFGILGCLVRLWQTRYQWWLWTALSTSVVLSVSQLYETYEQDSQQLIVVHAIPKTTAVSIVQGRRAILLADSTFLADKRSYNFFLNNFYAKHGIQYIDRQSFELAAGVRALPFGKLYETEQHRLAFIDKPIDQFAGKYDLIVVQEGAFRNVENAAPVLQNQTVVFDNSNKNYLSKQLHQRAKELELSYHFTNEQGAFVLTKNR